MQPIGYLESCYKDKFGVPRQARLVPESRAFLRLRADLQPELALEGLSGYSHLWLIGLFHLNHQARYRAKIHPPRLAGETRGIFATRTPHRPNPIALSLVEIIEVRPEGILLGGIDLMDKTPILDIKPYLPEIEAVPEAKATWVPALEEGLLEVTFTEQAERDLQNWQRQISDVCLRKLIVETIRQDPRPRLYRDDADSANPKKVNHAFRLFDGDVRFRQVGKQISVYQLLAFWDPKDKLDQLR